MHLPPDDRWVIDFDNIPCIAWLVRDDPNLPHGDHIEMSGRLVSLVAHLSVDRRRNLDLRLECIWPALRTSPDDVRGYLRASFGPETDPTFAVSGKKVRPRRVDAIQFDGVLRIAYAPVQGVWALREIHPELTASVVTEHWSFRDERGPVEPDGVSALSVDTRVQGMYGKYSVTRGSTSIFAGPRIETLTHAFAMPMRRLETRAQAGGARSREELLEAVGRNLVLETPHAGFDTAFGFAKVRAAESVFATKVGLVHSPGGGRYYGGVWANDQAEYAGPFFPFLGEPAAIEASLNCYRLFAATMKPDYGSIPSSLEMEGDIHFRGAGDRGDAAMVGYGASRFALALGDRAVAEELWPAVQWCLEYCRRRTNAHGVVESDSDELEGRFPTGKANLSTSSLTYGALRSGANLARALGEAADGAEFDSRADALAHAIEAYFGADMGGYATYRYYEGNTVLRSWISMPLVMGIRDRAAHTVAALLSPRLWTPNGVATEEGGTVYWDRATLYALRGALLSGIDTDHVIEMMVDFCGQRLVRDHVPYAVEAWPEGDMAHLSAESALFCRMVVEGLFGLEPLGFRSFRCTPRLHSEWVSMALKRVQGFGTGKTGFGLEAISGAGGVTHLMVKQRSKPVQVFALGPGEGAEVTLQD